MCAHLTNTFIVWRMVSFWFQLRCHHIEWWINVLRCAFQVFTTTMAITVMVAWHNIGYKKGMLLFSVPKSILRVLVQPN